MHPYGIPGRARQVAYLGTLGLCVAGASAAAAAGPVAVFPGFFLSYLLVYPTHEYLAWRGLRALHGVPDLSGRWTCGADSLLIRQTWTRLSLTGSIEGSAIVSRMAAWQRDPHALLITVAAASTLRCLRLRPQGPDELAVVDGDGLPTVWTRAG